VNPGPPRALSWLAAAALALVPGVAAAQAPESEPFSLAAFGIKGQLQYRLAAFFSETANDDRLFRNEGRLQLEWARRFAPWIDTKLGVEARKDDHDDARGVTFQIPVLELEVVGDVGAREARSRRSAARGRSGTAGTRTSSDPRRASADRAPRP
jgi:hypothetical protein